MEVSLNKSQLEAQSSHFPASHNAFSVQTAIMFHKGGGGGGREANIII